MIQRIGITLLFLLSFAGNIFAQPWQEQTSGVTVQLTSISCIDNSNDWACGYSGTVLRSTTSGNSWINVSGNGIPATLQLVNVFGINSTTALVAGYIGADTWVYRTSNSGANWVQVFTQTGGFINGLVIRLDGTGIMAGDPVGGRWSLWKTSNNGVNWDSAGLYIPQAGTETGFNNCIVYVQNRIWFGTNNSRIYYSSNNGINWSNQNVSVTEVTSLWFDLSGNTTGFCGGSSLLKTTDYGASWSTITSLGTGLIVGIAGLNMWSGNIWYVRSGGGSIYYNDGNGFGMIDYTAPAGTYRYVTTDRLANFPYIGFAVRTNGGISYKQIFVEGINILNGEVPEKYELFQNYPNPFNPATKIKFSIPKTPLSFGEGLGVGLIIYDALGREVQILVNENLSPGVYEVEFDGTNFPSGVYFCKFTVDENYGTGGFSEINKMVLIK